MLLAFFLGLAYFYVVIFISVPVFDELHWIM